MTKKLKKLSDCAEEMCEKIDEHNEFVVNVCGDFNGAELSIAGNTALIIESLARIIEHIDLDRSENDEITDFDLIIEEIVNSHKRNLVGDLEN